MAKCPWQPYVFFLSFRPGGRRPPPPCHSTSTPWGGQDVQAAPRALMPLHVHAMGQPRRARHATCTLDGGKGAHATPRPRHGAAKTCTPRPLARWIMGLHSATLSLSEGTHTYRQRHWVVLRLGRPGLSTFRDSEALFVRKRSLPPPTLKHRRRSPSQPLPSRDCK